MGLKGRGLRSLAVIGTLLLIHTTAFAKRDEFRNLLSPMALAQGRTGASGGTGDQVPAYILYHYARPGPAWSITLDIPVQSDTGLKNLPSTEAIGRLLAEMVQYLPETSDLFERKSPNLTEWKNFLQIPAQVAQILRDAGVPTRGYSFVDPESSNRLIQNVFVKSLRNALKNLEVSDSNSADEIIKFLSFEAWPELLFKIDEKAKGRLPKLVWNPSEKLAYEEAIQESGILIKIFDPKTPGLTRQLIDQLFEAQGAWGLHLPKSELRTEADRQVPQTTGNDHFSYFLSRLHQRLFQENIPSHIRSEWIRKMQPVIQEVALRQANLSTTAVQKLRMIFPQIDENLSFRTTPPGKMTWQASKRNFVGWFCQKALGIMAQGISTGFESWGNMKAQVLITR